VKGISPDGTLLLEDNPQVADKAVEQERDIVL
jgi:hypothetical protein